jgi:DNA-binding LytR/AlgR family response regulator
MFESNKSLKSIQDDLDERIFIEVHRSYIINMLHICDVHKDYVKMNNGKKVPISRRRNKEVIQKIVDFDKQRM